MSGSREHFQVTRVTHVTYSYRLASIVVRRVSSCFSRTNGLIFSNIGQNISPYLNIHPSIRRQTNPIILLNTAKVCLLARIKSFEVTVLYSLKKYKSRICALNIDPDEDTFHISFSLLLE